MKYLIVVIVMILTSHSALSKECRPLSFIQSAESAKTVEEYQAINTVTCKEAPEEECLCAKFPLLFSSVVDNEILDYISKLNETSCSDIADCDAKFETTSCDVFYEKIKNYDLLQVYCVKNIMKVDGKKLIYNAAKNDVFDAAQEAKRIAKDARIAQKEASKSELFALKKADIDAMTVSQRNAAIVKLINIVQEIDE